MALSASRSKSVAFDELAHVAAGAGYWFHGDFRLQPENGNFPQRWAALPFLFSRPKFPSITDPAWVQPDVWGLGAGFLSRSANDPDRLLFAARAMIAVLGAATAALVFYWARELHGTGGGFVALALAVFCPALLAHGAIATSDLALAGTLLATTWSWWRLLQRITVARLTASALAVALLFLTKMSAPLFVPVAAILALVRLAAGRAWRIDFGRTREWQSRRAIAGGILVLACLHAVVAWGAIWAAYDFRFAAAPPSLAGARELPFDFQGDAGWPVRVLHAAASARLLPQAFLYGYEWVLRGSAYRFAFFNGEHGFGGWISFFPYLFVVKTPLAFFPLFAVASWQIVRRCTARTRETLYALAPLLALVLVFGGAALTTHLNIGHRHILPLLPPLYILAGAAWPAAAAARGWRRFGVAALVGGFALESWLIRPHYLAFFNAFAGGPDRAWHHVVDSSLDWGMDLPALRDWLQKNRRPDEPVHFGYFGMGTPGDYDIPAVSLTTYYGAESRVIAPLRPGLFVVSATLLQVYAPAFGPWNKAYEARYQEAVATLEPLYAASPAQRERLLADKGAAYWTQAHRTLNDLRFARLCAWLRQRPPLAQIAHTLLVWRLGEQDLFDAQYGPPAELAEAPVAFPAGTR
jgi:4-amino-4-deoxy-L-arabinose transferase-like glycosyltransferase